MTDKYIAKMDSGHYNYVDEYWEVEIKANDLNVLNNICSAINLIKNKNGD